MTSEVIHFTSYEILPALTGKDSVDRLAVIVSGDGIMKLLGVPKIHRGTGEAQAQAVYQMINEWKLNNHVQLMCFDTTASNTGIKAGACVLLQQELEKPLISLACRHHVHELIVAKVFDVLWGAPAVQTSSCLNDFLLVGIILTTPSMSLQ